jgi:HDOD domain
VLDRASRRVRELAADPESDTNELVNALEANPGLAANVLRFANSAACARPIRAHKRGPWLAAVREQLDARPGVVFVADVRGLGSLDARHGYACGQLVLLRAGANSRPTRLARRPRSSLMCVPASAPTASPSTSCSAAHRRVRATTSPRYARAP